jgi:hypothetical protein
VAGTTTRARVVDGDKQTPVGIADNGTVTADPYIDQALPDGEGGRVLVTGAALDEGWRAVTVGPDGQTTDLEPVAGPALMGWAQGFTAPAGTPKVTVSFNSTPRSIWMWFELAVLLALIVMALPERRRIDPDPDLDDPDPDPDPNHEPIGNEEVLAMRADEQALADSDSAPRGES